jgi:hypothetical protein
LSRILCDLPVISTGRRLEVLDTLTSRNSKTQLTREPLQSLLTTKRPKGDRYDPTRRYLATGHDPPPTMTHSDVRPSALTCRRRRS